MPTAKLDEWATAHAHDVCIVQLSSTHSPHNTYQKNSAHCLSQAHCALHSYALHYKRHQIRSWLRESKIDCVHVGYDASGQQVRTCQLEVNQVMVKRCICETFRRRAESESQDEKEASDGEGSEDKGSEEESEQVDEESKSEGEEEGSVEEEQGSVPGAFFCNRHGNVAGST